MSENEGNPIIAISPEPSPEELAAIVAAVTAALQAVEPAGPPSPPPASAWQRQGRREAVAPFERQDRP